MTGDTDTRAILQGLHLLLAASKSRGQEHAAIREQLAEVLEALKPPEGPSPLHELLLRIEAQLTEVLRRLPPTN